MQLELTKFQKLGTITTIIAVCLGFGALLEKTYLNYAVIGGIIYYLTSGSRPTYIFAIIKCAPRDFNAGFNFLHMSHMLKKWENKNYTVAELFERTVRRTPNKIAFVMDDRKLTFNDMNVLSNAIAEYFKSQQFKRGDTVALFLDTCLEYSSIWVGLSKLGVVTALINSNLRKEVLAYSIKVAGSKAIIVGSDLLSDLKDILDDEGVKGLPIYVLNDNKTNASVSTDFHDLLSDIEPFKDIKQTFKMAENSVKDKLVYIYTSGTTGLPKAAVITNLRFMFMAMGCNKMLGIRNDDVVYNPLPLYHTAGGMVGVGNVLIAGVTMAIRKKFSASNFWSDCIKYDCTVGQYIGELCRFLLMTKEQPQDTQHKIRMMFGNGLRPQIWPAFMKRFNIQNIGEVYGSTEGNSNLANTDNTVGAIGFVPRFAEIFYPVTLIKCDEETGEPIRNSGGTCIRCKPGEAGVFVGKINAKKPSSAFGGYADKGASEKKILRNVLRYGDTFFNSGDILVMDIFGYYYFKDRTGDTFRWRGENVATAEVEAVISNIVKLNDCVVYGVDIPETEGKAGMAAIVDKDHLINLENLSANISSRLPPYARPVFLRLLAEVPMTGTFKLKKRDLQTEGFNINEIKDPIYFLNPKGIYTKLTEELYTDIQNGKARL